MNRRELLITTSAVGLSASLSTQVNAQVQSSFAYSTPITISERLAIPGKGKLKVAFAINPGVQVIDLAGPWEVFQDVLLEENEFEMLAGPAFELYTVSESTSPLEASGGLKIIPHYAVDNAPQPDLVVIPHFNTRETTVIHEWIKAAHLDAGLTVSICTGAFQLAKTGLLNGKPATTNQDAYDIFAELFPEVNLQRGPRFVETGKIATAGGLTAGIDLALRIVDRYFGREVAQVTADRLEYVSTGWRV